MYVIFELVEDSSFHAFKELVCIIKNQAFCSSDFFGCDYCFLYWHYYLLLKVSLGDYSFKIFQRCLLAMLLT